MTEGPKCHRMSVALRGTRGAWRSTSAEAPGPGPPSINAPAPIGKVDGRHPDGLPKPQAFSLPTIQCFPARTAACRTCVNISIPKCSRGVCEKLGAYHAALLNAINDGKCPIGRFTEEL